MSFIIIIKEMSHGHYINQENYIVSSYFINIFRVNKRLFIHEQIICLRYILSICLKYLVVTKKNKIIQVCLHLYTQTHTHSKKQFEFFI